MSGFKIHVTTQGREALPNADNTGTVSITVASIGITAQAFDDSSSPTSLPGEIKRLATFSGVAVADDTIHITIRDDSADVYDMRGFGIYLADGTLAACYSQEDVILGKSALTMLLLSTDIRFVDVDATSIVFGGSTWSNPPGSETVAGVLKLSTDTQAIAGNDRATAVPPGALKAALDARLGAGSPSAYIKGLLAAATATAARIALGIKSAALKDEGTGNGLDADFVDGKHAADFAGAAHSHNLQELGGTLPIAKGGTGATDASGARANLGLGTAAMGNTGSGNSFDADTVDGKHAADFAGAAHSHNLPDLGGTLPITKGGTGATDAPGARSNLGLGNVDNTRDADKPISTATQSALNRKANLDSPQFTGTPSVSGYSIWNAGNFDPGTKASLAGANYFTDPNPIIMSNGTQVNQFNVGDRAGWYDVGAGKDIWFYTFATKWFTLNTDMTVVGSLYAGGGFQPASSRELKTAFRQNPYGLSAVLKLETTLGKYREWFNSDGRERVFLIAENIAEVMPQVADGDGIEATPPGEAEPRKFKGYSIEQMLAVYAKAFQDLHAIVQAQGERIATLEQDA